MEKVVIYLRVSSDPDGGELSITRHRNDCVDLCKRQGWTVVEECVDNDISASRYSRKRRPGWARVLELVEAGHVNRIVAWDLDRMLRQPRELEDLIDRADKGLPVTTISGDVRLDTADGRFITRILVAKAAKESDDLSRRIRRAREAAAAQGRPGAGIVAFGWADNGTTIVEHEAEAIRDAAQRVVNGEISVAAVAREWTAKGLRRPKGGRVWSGTTVRDVLGSPRNAGLLQFRGKVIGEGNWPPIIDRVTHQRLVRKFDERRLASPPRRVTTFTTVFRCGLCNRTLTLDKTNQQQVFRCKPTSGSSRCGKIAISAQPVMDAVLEYLFLSLEGDPVELHNPEEKQVVDAANQLRLIEDRKDELAQAFAQRHITMNEWRVAKEVLDSEAAKWSEIVDGRRGPTRVRQRFSQPGVLRERWGSLTPTEQNSILCEVFVAVLVKPATKQCRGVDRLEFVCRK